MKKIFTTLLLLFTVISITVAQSPAMINKGDTDIDNSGQYQESNRLSVEIVDIYGTPIPHPYPETGIACPFELILTTNRPNTSHHWETDLQCSNTYNENRLAVTFNYSGYVKVTVSDSYGHTGSDSIWFNVQNANVPPMEDFMMEIDDDLHPKFSGIATEDYDRIIIDRGFTPGEFINSEIFLLSPGIWNYEDTNAIYSDDTLWIYDILILNQCQSGISYLVPGVLLGTEEQHLTIKSILQDENAPMYYDSFVYFIYTVDREGHRHQLTDELGEPIILPPKTTTWNISPDILSHPFYQCGVAKGNDDGSYELLSLSNKVVNPYYPYYPYPYEALQIEDIEEGHTYDYCMYHYGNQPFIALLGETDCPQQSWELESNGEHFSQAGDSITVANPYETRMWDIIYHGCDKDVSFHILFYDPAWDNPFAAPILWKHDGETVSLTALDDEIYASGDIDCQWSTGEATNRIEATETGTYSVSISAHGCSDTYSMELRDNVEMALATVDLKTGRDKVIWQVNPKQAEYIDKVKVIRYDGSAYAAPYDQGYYLLYSVEDVARNYHIVAVSKEGQDCPVASYEKGTIHATYEQAADGSLNIHWNTPYVEAGATNELTGFQICLYNPDTEAVTAVDEVDANATNYVGDAHLFSGGMVVIAAVFGNNGDRSFSNLYSMLAVGENAEGGFNVYPNPSNGRFTVEGKGQMTVSNLLGQIILSKEIDGQTTMELPQGLYFVKLGSAVRKVVVE